MMFTLTRVSTIGRSCDINHLKARIVEESEQIRVWMKRKGRRRYTEQVLARFTPWWMCAAELIIRYKRWVNTEEGHLWRSLHHPRVEITDNTVAGIVRRALDEAGKPIQYGAHALKGATIDFLLDLGLEMRQIMSRGEMFSEEVVRKHYSRWKKRKDTLEKMVTTTRFTGTTSSLSTLLLPSLPVGGTSLQVGRSRVEREEVVPVNLVVVTAFSRTSFCFFHLE